MAEWIRTAERLPPLRMLKLCRIADMHGNFVSLDCLYLDGPPGWICWRHQQTGLTDFAVTHWMDLPDPPICDRWVSEAGTITEDQWERLTPDAEADMPHAIGRVKP